MACFALWRIAQGVLDADDLGNKPRALVRRAAYTVSSLAYLALAAMAVGTIFQVSTSSPRSWAALDSLVGLRRLRPAGVGGARGFWR